MAVSLAGERGGGGGGGDGSGGGSGGGGVPLATGDGADLNAEGDSAGFESSSEIMGSEDIGSSSKLDRNRVGHDYGNRFNPAAHQSKEPKKLGVMRLRPSFVRTSV